MRAGIRSNTDRAMSRILQFAHDEQGQDLIEYSLLVTFIAIACLALLGTGHPATVAIWQTANADISMANSVVFGH
jgi:Flp pilus assembly pilin Flp